MRAVDAVFLVALAATCAGHSTPATLFTPYVPVHPLDEGYFPLPRFLHRVETGLLQEHPIASVPVAHPQPSAGAGVPLLADQPFLAFVAPSSSSLVAYVPVHRGRGGPWAVPNVFIKGQGYSTNRYVAPAVMQRHLAQDPR